MQVEHCKDDTIHLAHQVQKVHRVSAVPVTAEGVFSWSCPISTTGKTLEKQQHMINIISAVILAEQPAVSSALQARMSSHSYVAS